VADLSTFWDSQGLSVTLYRPSVALTPGSPNTVIINPRGQLLDDQFQQRLTLWEHEAAAVGGFTHARAQLEIQPTEMDWWLQRLLGAHVEVTSGAGERVWEGFVDRLDVVVGGASITYGPLSAIMNRMRVIYQRIDTSTQPPTGYEQVMTDLAEDSASQAQFGIWKGYTTGGKLTTALAQNLRDTALAELAWPKFSQKITVGEAGSGAVSVALEMSGYYAYLLYPYESTTTGTQNVDTKIAAVLDADINGLFASTNAMLATNTLAVPAYDHERRAAWTVLKELVGYGDASANAYTLQVRADRQVIYEQVSDAVAYEFRIAAEAQEVLTSDQTRVELWQVRPGRWMRTSGMFVGRHDLGPSRQDVRYVYIEGLTFSAPDRLVVSGGDVDTLPAMLSRLGLINAR